MTGILILIGIILGAVAWHIGLLIADDMRKRHGCYDHCEYCGKPIPKPLSHFRAIGGSDDNR